MINTRDLGLAIRDHLEEKTVTHFAEDADGALREMDCFEVTEIDVSDPSNLLVYTSSGRKFRVRIFSEG